MGKKLPSSYHKAIAFCGTRGIPAAYGGFETAVDEITKWFTSKGYTCHIFGRSESPRPSEVYDSRKMIYVKGSKSKKLDTFVSAIYTGLYLRKHRAEYDYVFWFNNANFPGIFITLLSGLPMAINTDGLEWRRAKWSFPFKAYYFISSYLIGRFNKTLISDSISISDYYKKKFNKKTSIIPYGVPQSVDFEEEVKHSVLEKYKLDANKYFLQITRLEPDNLPLEIICGFINSGIWKQGYKFLLIGMKEENPYTLSLKRLSGSNGVNVSPANYNPVELEVLRRNAFCYLHGNSVGGTNPALLEAMKSCNRIMAINGPFSKEVLGNNGILFDIEKLDLQFKQVLELKDESAELKERVLTLYNWETVSNSYEKIMKSEKVNYFFDRLLSNQLKEPRIGIVLVNYNGFEDTISCIKSILRSNYKNYKIYLVDNNSPDGSGQLLREYYNQDKFQESIKVLLLNKNIGFSGGNNVAIDIALKEESKYVWLLNNDTIIDEKTLTNLVVRAESDELIGIVGSKIYFYNSSDIWYAGGSINKFAISSHRGSLTSDRDNKLFNIPEEVDFVTGCSLFARSKMIYDIGKLDEDFFLYFEDTELNHRAKQNGWKIYYEPSSLVWHKVSASTGSKYRDHSPLIDYYDTRNFYLFINKCYKGRGRILAFAGFIFKFIKKNIRIALRKETNKMKKYKIIYIAIFDAINKKNGNYLKS
ncbi:DUF1972 domain-containing protein [Paenibacillus sp. D9]|uniref:DUF1972 domain-containing protein n=1 Tax=Paenibacillus sp. D9 TaxID=665792 RepID=UPI000A02113E|nr:DUF1972 domain-containing protein [Paenibacillus sp. D9]